MKRCISSAQLLAIQLKKYIGNEVRIYIQNPLSHTHSYICIVYTILHIHTLHTIHWNCYIAIYTWKLECDFSKEFKPLLIPFTQKLPANTFTNRVDLAGKCWSHHYAMWWFFFVAVIFTNQWMNDECIYTYTWNINTYIYYLHIYGTRSSAISSVTNTYTISNNLHIFNKCRKLFFNWNPWFFLLAFNHCIKFGLNAVY